MVVVVCDKSGRKVVIPNCDVGLVSIDTVLREGLVNGSTVVVVDGRFVKNVVFDVVVDRVGVGR